MRPSRHTNPGRHALFLLLAALIALALGEQLVAAQEDAPTETQGRLTPYQERFLQDYQPPQPLAPASFTPCVGGFAGIYPCQNVDLLAFMPLASIGGGSGNDIWGWTDPVTGYEYALMGRSSGTAFVDISDPVNPVYVGNLLTHSSNSTWRDIKVYADHAFIVSEASSHGMQVFDLTQLRSVANPPVTFAETAHYPGFGSAHNIVINEQSGFAYAVGANSCSGGLHMVNIANPTSPAFAGCFSADGYTHDAQCVNYVGPDPDHQGSEICFNANEDTITIVDVTNKANPVMLSRTGYTGAQYTHQLWVTEDQRFLLVDDELDEVSYGHNTRTRVFKISNLDAPSLVGYQDLSVAAIDHNLYVADGFVYAANYRSGLRILDAAGVATASLPEVGYFDIYPANNNPSFNGAWSVYPYFDSGVVVVSGIEQGLFILDPAFGPDIDVAPGDLSESLLPGGLVTRTLSIGNAGTTDLAWSTFEDGSTLASDVPCAAASDIPWLSVAPTAGTTAPAAMSAIEVVFDAGGLAPGEHAAHLCVASNDPDPGPGNGTDLVVVPLALTVDTPAPAIAVTKTVGTLPDVCAAGNTITVEPGTDVYYCVSVHNTGDWSLPLHDLQDDQLGTILAGLTYDLAPGAVLDTVTAGLTLSATIDVTTTSTSTWTAYDGVYDATDSAATTVYVDAQPAITLRKTVGLDPGVCAAGKNLLVTGASAEVTYCYTVTNAGNVTLITHDLVDDQLGVLLTDYAHDLLPGASVFVTETVVLTETTVNEATWTAVGASGPAVSAGDTATVTVASGSQIYLPFVTATTGSSSPAQAPSSWITPWVGTGLLTILPTLRRRG